MPARLGVIADDLTGAGDTGLQFGKRGLRTVVLLDLPAAGGMGGPASGLAEADVLVVDTDSRAASTDAAYRRVREAASALLARGVAQLYKKVDSTLRGNVGSEIDALLDETGASAALVAPAFPANGRTVAGGRLLVHGVPLAETDFARDPIWPARDSHVPAILAAQTRRPVGQVELATIRGGAVAIAAAVEAGRRRDGVQVFVLDAVRSDDLAAVARTVVASAGRWIGVGSAGLAEHLPDALGLAALTPDLSLGEREQVQADRPLAMAGGGVPPSNAKKEARESSTPSGQAPRDVARGGENAVRPSPVAGAEPDAAGKGVRGLGQLAPTLVVVGSVNSLARRQLAVLVECRSTVVVELDAIGCLERAVRPPADQTRLVERLSAAAAGDVASAAAAARRALADGQDVVLALAAPSRGCDRADARGCESADARGCSPLLDAAADRAADPVSGRLSALAAELRLSPGEVARAVVGVLAQATAATWRSEAPIGGLVLTGGDTARAICRALGALGLVVESEVLAGIPCCHLVGGPAAGLAVITKAGGFGPPEALARAVEYLQDRSTRCRATTPRDE